MTMEISRWNRPMFRMIELNTLEGQYIWIRVDDIKMIALMEPKDDSLGFGHSEGSTITTSVGTFDVRQTPATIFRRIQESRETEQ